MALPTALVVLADAKPHLNIPSTDTSHDTEIQGFIDAAQPIIEDVVGPVVPVSLDEWYDGGQTFIILRRRPLLSVEDVTEYWGPAAYVLAQVATPVLGTTFSYSWEPTGRIVRRAAGGGVRSFPNGPQTVHVRYTAGRASVPANVRLATLELVHHNYQMTQQPGRPSFTGMPTEDQLATTPSGFAIPTRVLEMLQAHRRAPNVG
jgi:hypothetical protein